MSKPKVYSYWPLECAVFENQSDKGINLSFKFQKVFKDKDGKYQQTEFLNESDLPKMSALASMVINSFCVKEKVFKEKQQKKDDFYQESDKGDF